MGFREYAVWIWRAGILEVLRSCWNKVWEHGIQRMLYGASQGRVVNDGAVTAQEQAQLPNEATGSTPRRNPDQLHRRPLHEGNDQQPLSFNIVGSSLNQSALASSNTTYSNSSVKQITHIMDPLIMLAKLAYTVFQNLGDVSSSENEQLIKWKLDFERKISAMEKEKREQFGNLGRNGNVISKRLQNISSLSFNLFGVKMKNFRRSLQTCDDSDRRQTFMNHIEKVFSEIQKLCSMLESNIGDLDDEKDQQQSALLKKDDEGQIESDQKNKEDLGEENTRQQPTEKHTESTADVKGDKAENTNNKTFNIEKVEGEKIVMGANVAAFSEGGPMEFIQPPMNDNSLTSEKAVMPSGVGGGRPTPTRDDEEDARSDSSVKVDLKVPENSSLVGCGKVNVQINKQYNITGDISGIKGKGFSYSHEAVSPSVKKIGTIFESIKRSVTEDSFDEEGFIVLCENLALLNEQQLQQVAGEVDKVRLTTNRGWELLPVFFKSFSSSLCLDGVCLNANVMNQVSSSIQKKISTLEIINCTFEYRSVHELASFASHCVTFILRNPSFASLSPTLSVQLKRTRGTKTLLQCIGHLDNLKTLDLSFINLEEGNAIKPVLDGNRGLQELILRGCTIGEDGLNSVVHHLSMTNNIRVLCISGVGLNDESLKRFVRNVISTSSSTCKMDILDITFNRIGRGALMALLDSRIAESIVLFRYLYDDILPIRRNYMYWKVKSSFEDVSLTPINGYDPIPLRLIHCTVYLVTTSPTVTDDVRRYLNQTLNWMEINMWFRPKNRGICPNCGKTNCGFSHQREVENHPDGCNIT